MEDEILSMDIWSGVSARQGVDIWQIKVYDRCMVQASGGLGPGARDSRSAKIET